MWVRVRVVGEGLVLRFEEGEGSFGDVRSWVESSRALPSRAEPSKKRLGALM